MQKASSVLHINQIYVTTILRYTHSTIGVYIFLFFLGSKYFRAGAVQTNKWCCKSYNLQPGLHVFNCKYSLTDMKLAIAFFSLHIEDRLPDSIKQRLARYEETHEAELQTSFRPSNFLGNTTSSNTAVPLWYSIPILR